MKAKIRVQKRRNLVARRARVKRRIARTGRPRLTVYRSARHIYAQIVDPISGRTISSVSSLSTQVIGDAPATGKVEVARRVGKAIAEVAKQKDIQEVVFNRNGFLYHGRVKALADAAREAGLRF